MGCGCSKVEPQNVGNPPLPRREGTRREPTQKSFKPPSHRPSKKQRSEHHVSQIVINNNESVDNCEEVPASYPPAAPPLTPKLDSIKNINTAIIDRLILEAPRQIQDDYKALVDHLNGTKTILKDQDETETSLYMVWLILRLIYKWYGESIANHVHQGQGQDRIIISNHSTGDSRNNAGAIRNNTSAIRNDGSAARNDGSAIRKNASGIRNNASDVRHTESRDDGHSANNEEAEVEDEPMTTDDAAMHSTENDSVGSIVNNTESVRNQRESSLHEDNVSNKSESINNEEEERDQSANALFKRKNQSQKHTPRGDLELVHEGHVDLAVLFAVICRRASIPCVIIRGQWKHDQYQVGDDVEQTRFWNAVYVSNNWRLIHPQWSIHRHLSSMSRHCDNITIDNTEEVVDFEDYYFLTDPEEFVTRCLPNDPNWQLLKKPVPEGRFREMPRFTEHFFKLGLYLSPDKDGIIETTDGKTTVTMEFPNGKQPQLYYHLIEIASENESESSLVVDQDLLRRCVYMYKIHSKYVFKLKFNKRGVYNLRMYGDILASVKTTAEHVPLLCQLQIHCKDPDKTWRPLPDCPAIGWGQSGLAAMMGVVPVSHKGGIAFTNEHSRVNFMFKLENDVTLHPQLISAKTGKVVHEPKCVYKGNKATLSIVLKGMSEASLRVNATSPPVGEFVNVCNFLVKQQQVPLETERARDRRLKNMLEAASKYGSESRLVRALDEYAMFIHADTGELEKAEDQLAFLRLRKGLFRAILRDFAPCLETSIYDAETSPFKEDLKNYIRVARAHLHNLKRFAPPRNHVLVLNQSLLMEIRSYMKPKSVIYHVMVSALLLLGENRQDLFEWKYVKGTLSRTGRQSILRCMERFESDRVSKDRVREAEKWWRMHSLETVWEASAGAAVIHKWIKEAIDKTKGIFPTDTNGINTGGSQISSDIPTNEQTGTTNDDFSGTPESRPNRKRKATGSLGEDSEDEVPVTAREISPEFGNSQNEDNSEDEDTRGRGNEVWTHTDVETGSHGQNGSNEDMDNNGL